MCQREDWTKNCNKNTVDIPAFVRKMEKVKAREEVDWTCPFCGGKVGLLGQEDGYTEIGCDSCDMRIKLECK